MHQSLPRWKDPRSGGIRLDSGEGFGANPIFSLSNFCLKLTDNPEFEDRFACRWREQQAAPLRWGEYEHTDNPYIYPSFSKFFGSARGHSKSLNSFVTLSALTSRFTRSPIFNLTFSKKSFASSPRSSSPTNPDIYYPFYTV